MDVMMEYDRTNLLWSEETTIQECVASKDLTFPKLIMITSGFDDNSYERSFDTNQIIWIGGTFTQNRIHGRTSQKCGINLPVCSVMKFTTESFQRPNLLFEILQVKKLPFKVSLSELSRDVFSDPNIENMPERLSKVKLKTTSTATFFYGVPLQETMPDASDMIILPPYLNLTFKVALSFKDMDKCLKNSLSELRITFKDWIKPDQRMIQDIVFQEHQGAKDIVFPEHQHQGARAQCNINPKIVSLKKPRQAIRMMLTRPPLPLPTMEIPPTDMDKDESVGSSASGLSDSGIISKYHTGLPIPLPPPPLPVQLRTDIPPLPKRDSPESHMDKDVSKQESPEHLLSENTSLKKPRQAIRMMLTRHPLPLPTMEIPPTDMDKDESVGSSASGLSDSGIISKYHTGLPIPLPPPPLPVQLRTDIPPLPKRDSPESHMDKDVSKQESPEHLLSENTSLKKPRQAIRMMLTRHPLPLPTMEIPPTDMDKDESVGSSASGLSDSGIISKYHTGLPIPLPPPPLPVKLRTDIPPLPKRDSPESHMDKDVSKQESPEHLLSENTSNERSSPKDPGNSKCHTRSAQPPKPPKPLHRSRSKTHTSNNGNQPNMESTLSPSPPSLRECAEGHYDFLPHRADMDKDGYVGSPLSKQESPEHLLSENTSNERSSPKDPGNSKCHTRSAHLPKPPKPLHRSRSKTHISNNGNQPNMEPTLSPSPPSRADMDKDGYVGSPLSKQESLKYLPKDDID